MKHKNEKKESMLLGEVLIAVVALCVVVAIKRVPQPLNYLLMGGIVGGVVGFIIALVFVRSKIKKEIVEGKQHDE